MSDTPRATDEAVASLDNERDSNADTSGETPEPAKEQTQPETAEAEPVVQEVYAEPTSSPIQLARIFSLLALVGVIGALGAILATYNHFEERVRSVEIAANTTQTIFETKVSALSGELSKEIANNRGTGARAVVIGGELSRTLYLMNALAEDTSLSPVAREKARAAHEQTAALLVEMQKLE